LKEEEKDMDIYFKYNYWGEKEKKRKEITELSGILFPWVLVDRSFVRDR